MFDAKAKRRVTKAPIIVITKHCNMTHSKAILEQLLNFSILKKDMKKDTPHTYRVPYTEDTVRGQHEGQLSFKRVLSCTVLRDGGPKPHN